VQYLIVYIFIDVRNGLAVSKVHAQLFTMILIMMQPQVKSFIHTSAHDDGMDLFAKLVTLQALLWSFFSWLNVLLRALKA